MIASCLFILYAKQIDVIKHEPYCISFMHICRSLVDIKTIASRKYEKKDIVMYYFSVSVAVEFFACDDLKLSLSDMKLC